MEFVWVVKRDELFQGRYPHGLEVGDELVLAEQVARILEHGFFVERRHAERDWTMKQVIPYCVVTRRREVDGARRAEVFRTRRLSKGGESRLHGKRSIGIGGHLNPVDAPDVVASGLRREVEEELVLDGVWTARAVGLLNDDATDVGAVHVGLVQLVEIEDDASVRETDTLEGAWVSVEELAESCRAERASYETWSALVIDRMSESDGRITFVPPGQVAARIAARITTEAGGAAPAGASIAAARMASPALAGSVPSSAG
ncbi:MAG: hypothetical protein K8T90_10250 [Planctomycetes bacterium]|nr:hypothetical protein [Planctomycetota bacterium]